MSDPGRPDGALALEFSSDTSLPGLMRALKARTMHRDGKSDQEIADAINVPVELVPLAIEVAEDRHPSFSVEDLTSAMMYKYQQKIGVLEGISANPGFRHDVKGDLMYGPDGQPEIDTERQIQAQREISRDMEALRKLTGTDAPVKRHLSIEEITRKESVRMLAQQLTLPEIEALDIVDGEIVYSNEGPSLQLGDGGLMREDEGDPGRSGP